MSEVTQRPADDPLTQDEIAVVRSWAAATWRSLEAMTHPTTGLPADHIGADLDPAGRSGYTSPTNIGGLLWSTVVARDLGLISPAGCRERLRATLDTLGRLDRHAATGMWWNWYDESDGTLVRVLDGRPLTPFASSVDNGWLGAALLLVGQAEPALARQAQGLTASMRWDVFCDPKAGPAGLIRNGFWLEQPPDRPSVCADHSGQGLELAYQANHYDTFVSETRIVTHLGILTGTIAPRQYFSARRDALEYRGMRIVPGWGGSMFEELMPDLLLPEAEWAPLSWGRNHRLHVRAQREHGLDETGYGYWGFSPSSVPPDGYREFGVDALGLDPAGYRSDIGTPADGQAWADGVVTPHAAFLAMMYEPAAAFDTLARLVHDFDAVGAGGFVDAIAVRSGTVAARHLSLDQAITLGACAVVLRRADGTADLRSYFTRLPGIERLRDVMAVEEFAAVPPPNP